MSGERVLRRERPSIGQCVRPPSSGYRCVGAFRIHVYGRVASPGSSPLMVSLEAPTPPSHQPHGMVNRYDKRRGLENIQHDVMHERVDSLECFMLDFNPMFSQMLCWHSGMCGRTHRFHDALAEACPSVVSRVIGSYLGAVACVGSAMPRTTLLAGFVTRT